VMGGQSNSMFKIEITGVFSLWIYRANCEIKIVGSV